MRKLIDAGALIERLNDFNKWCKDGRLQGSLFAIDVIADMPIVQSVSEESYNQVMWERDIAIQQLQDLGYAFGEKVDGKVVPQSEFQELEDKFKKVCVALVNIMDEECCTYGYDEATDIADNYLAKIKPYEGE